MMEKNSNLRKDIHIQSQNTMRKKMKKMISKIFFQISNIKIIEL